MKKYRALELGVLLLYLICGMLLFAGGKWQQRRQEESYRVEINRLTAQARERAERGEEPLWGGTDREWERVEQISYLPSDVTDISEIAAFYQTINQMRMEVVPLIVEEEIRGYLRFDYRTQTASDLLIYGAEGILFLMAVLTMLILVHLERTVMRPFQTLSELPYELAKGNLTGHVKENKNRYFGKFVWGIGMLKDTLDTHKKQELKLVRDKKMLLMAISHDIKTPLNAIQLYARAIEEEIYETLEEEKEAAVQIRRKTEEIDSFVKEIIKSSTEDLLVIEVKQGEFYLQELVDKIELGFGEKCRIRKTNFTIGTFANYLMEGDADRLYEAVGNLMENALKYGDGKEIRITFREEDYCVLLSVYNSGEVVRDQDVPHLFDSFYRGSNTVGKAGNGLGLYICGEIMKKCQGDIFARRLPEGMEFVLVCRMCGR